MNDQSMTDDQELAKVLAGVSQDSTMQFEETGAPAAPVVTPLQTPETAADPAIIDPITPLSGPTADDQGMNIPVETGAPVNADAPITPPTLDHNATVSTGADLEQIKQTALTQLRPLVGKLNLSPEEKFDTYLLLLRSTDDRELIAPAHEAAASIADEARKAQALLDIIKEIDFLSQK